LNENLVSDLPLRRANEMSFVEDDQTNVLDQLGVVPSSEIELLRCGDHDVAIAESVEVSSSGTGSAV
jgi:hypothetical protein